MTVVLGTLGFTPGKFLPTLRTTPGVERAVVFHDRHDDSREAARVVRAYCDEMALTLDAVELDAFDILSCAKEIRARLRQHARDDLVFNITGGTSIVSSAALLTCILEGVRAVTVDERTGEEVQLPLLAMRYEELLNPAQRRILGHVLKHPGCTQKDIAAGLGLTKGTVSHHVSNLKDRALLTAKPMADGRAEALEVIESGDLLIMDDVEDVGDADAGGAGGAGRR